MRYPGPEAERAAWRDATTLAGLGELTAQWLEGEISVVPGQEAPPSAETADLAAVLAQINRAGLVTDFSQPADPDPVHTQRAAVSGFCSELSVLKLEVFLARTDFVLLATGPHAIDLDRTSLVVTMDGLDETTWCGLPNRAVDIADIWAPMVSAEAVQVLLTSWQVQLIDPVWGRNDKLWPALLTALQSGPGPDDFR